MIFEFLFRLALFYLSIQFSFSSLVAAANPINYRGYVELAGFSTTVAIVGGSGRKCVFSASSNC